MVLAIVLTAWNYSSQPMWRDEWYTYSTANRPLAGMVNLLSHSDGGLAGFYLLMHFWMLAGDSVAWMRLPAALCTVLLAALTALVGRRVGGTAVGVVSGVVVTVLPVVVQHAQEARAYPLVLAAVTATGLAALRYGERPSVGRWSVLAVLALAGAALHPLPGAPAVAGIFVGLLWSPGAASRWRVLLAGAPAAAAALALVAVANSQLDVTNVGNGGGLRQAVGVRYLMAPGYGSLLAALLLSVLAVVVLRHQSDHLAVLAGWALVPLLALTTLIALGSFFQTRYAAAAVPAAAVLIAVGTVTLATVVARAVPPRNGVLTRSVAIALIASALVLPLVPSVVQARTEAFQVDDPRSATDALVAGYRNGDAVIYASTSVRGLVGFYAPTGADLADPLLLRSPLASDTVGGVEVAAAGASAATRGFRRVWVIGTTPGVGAGWHDQDEVDAATAGRTSVEDRTFGSVRLQLWGSHQR